MQAPPLTCPTCGTLIQPAWRVCPHCGRALSVPVPLAGPVVQLACPACGGRLPVPAAGQAYIQCPYCRNALQLQQDAGGLSLALANQVGEILGARIGEQVGAQVRRELATARPGREQPAETRLAQEAELDRLEAQATLQRIRIGQLRRTGSPAALQNAEAALRQTEERIAALRHALHLPIAAPPTPNWLAAHPLWVVLGIGLVVAAGVAAPILLWAAPWLGQNTLAVALGVGGVVGLAAALAVLLNNAS